MIEPRWIFSSADDSLGVGELIIILNKDLIFIDSFEDEDDPESVLNYDTDEWEMGHHVVRFNSEDPDNDGGGGTPVYCWIYLNETGQFIEDYETLIKLLKSQNKIMYNEISTF